MGAATSWRLAHRGVDVVCYDRYSPPHSLGSTHGDSRIIRTAYFEGGWYVPLVREAFTLWRELESETGADLLTMTGALMIGEPDSAAVKGALDSAKTHGLEIEQLDAVELGRRYPGHIVPDGQVAVLDKQAGILHPEAAVAAMLSRTPAVVRDSPVTSLADLVDNFDAIVVAAGPWTPELIDWIPLRVERQVHVWFAIARDADWFTPDRFPAFVRQTEENGFMYGIPALDKKTVKVGRHHDGETTDPHRIRRRVDEFDLDPLRLLTATYMRGVSGHVRHTITCMYTNTPDNHFVIDFSPDHRRVLVISACSGHGFKFGPVIGDIAADLV